MRWIVKLTKHGNQYRVTLPRKLVEEAGLKNVEYVQLRSMQVWAIKIEEYHGKGKEKGDLPEDQT